MANIGVTGPTNTLTSTLLGNASSIVAYAHGRVHVVDSFIGQLSNAVLSLQAPIITPEFPTGGVLPAIAVPEPPEFEAPVWVAPAMPSAFAEVLNLGDLEVEAFDIDPPEVLFGTAPAPFVGVMPDAPGINIDFEDPDLVVELPAPPALLALSVSSFAGINMPTFDEAAPTLEIVEPSIREYVPGAEYTSALLTALEQSLLERIQNGGTGIGDAELPIWERGREREARAAADALAKLDQMEALGYAFPPGIYLDARIKIITETDYAERGHSREVMIKSAEMQLENVKHALTTAVQVEGQLLDHTNAVEQRLFESSRYATEAGIAIHNAKVQAFTALVEVYRSKVGVYEALVRAETQKVEAYKAQIGAEEAKARVNQALVDQYRAQIEAALSNVKVFEARIAGIQAKADIEKTKVMIFGEQVKGYATQVNAYTAGVEAFRAGLLTEQTKQQVYQAQVDAFNARVNASVRQIEARISAYKGRIDAKTAEFDGYRAAVQGESSRIQALTQMSGVVADTYKSEVAATSAYNETLLKQWQVVLDQNQRTAEIGISTAKANAELYISSRSLGLEAAKTGAQVAAQIGSAAINAVNFSGSVSSSEGFSQSVGVSNSVSSSTSSSVGTSTNYNYNASV